MLWVKIVIYTSVAILAILMSIFSFIFFFHRLLVMKVCGYKERYNNQKISVFNFLYRHLEIVGEYDNNIKNFLVLLKENKKEIDDKLKIIYNKLNVVSWDVEKYHHFEVIKKLREIKNNQDNIAEQIAYNKKVSSQLNEKYKKLSDFIVTIINIYNSVLSFNKEKIGSICRNDVFKNINISIKLKLEEINTTNFSVGKEKGEYLENVAEILKKTSDFYILTTQTFCCLEAFKALVSVRNRITENLSNIEMPEQEKSLIRQQLVFINQKVKEIELEFNDFEFGKILNNIFAAFSILDTMKKKITIYKKLQDVQQEDYQVLTNVIETIESKTDEIFKYIRFFAKQFELKDEQTFKMVEEIKKETQNILTLYEILKNNTEEKKFVSLEYIKSLSNISNKIINWQKLVNVCLELIEIKYAKFINTFNRIAQINLSLSFLLDTAISNNNQQEIEILTSLRKDANLLSDTIKEKYVQENKKWEKELVNLETIIEEIYNSQYFEETITGIAEKLLFYANKLRYSNNNIKEEMQVVDKIIEQKNYNDAVTNLIILLENFKAENSGEKIF